MLRAAELALPLLKAGYGLRFALLPAGEDPDSLVRRLGPGAVRQTFAQARALSQILWENALARYGDETPEKRAALEQQLLKTADRIADPLVRQHMRSYFRDRMFQLAAPKKNARRHIPQAQLGVLPDANDDKSHLKPLEDQIVALVLQYPEMLHVSDIEEHFGHMDFTQPLLDKVRAATLEVTAGLQTVDSALLIQSLAARGFGEKVETLLQSKSALMTTLLSVRHGKTIRAWPSRHLKKPIPLTR